MSTSQIAVLQVYSTHLTLDDLPLKTLQFSGAFGQLALLPESNALWIGTRYEATSKTIDPFAQPDWFRLGANVAKLLRKTAYRKLSLCLDWPQEALKKFWLGVMQGALSFDVYRPKEKPMVLNVMHDALTQHITHLTHLHDTLQAVRWLINETPACVNPSTITAHVQAMLAPCPSIALRVLNTNALQEMGMNGILAVGRASIHPPIVLHATLPAQGEVKQTVILVGKGVTYDCGGLDIKTNGHMRSMKCDMAGAATLLGVLRMVGLLGLQHTTVHWVAAFAENMIDGGAYKSDDILTTYSGQTVEIRNTDAEGRLLLADCLSYATLLEPTYILDAATLTGACCVALSEHVTALMTNSDVMQKSLMAAFIHEQEPTAHVTLPEILRTHVTGNISDLINTSTLERQAGHQTAALFLSHFVDQTLFSNPVLSIKTPRCFEWAHLDIAGTAFNKNNNQLSVDGATGQSVRSLVHWLCQNDKL
jgi:leucyl aminopeptidase